MQKSEWIPKLPNDEMFSGFNEIIAKSADAIKKKFIDNPTNSLLSINNNPESCVQEQLDLKEFDSFLQSCLYIVFVVSFGYSKKENIPHEHRVVFDGMKQHFMNMYFASSAYNQQNDKYDINNIVIKIQEVTGEANTTEDLKKQSEAIKKILRETIGKITEIESRFDTVLEALEYKAIDLDRILSYLEHFISKGVFVYPEISISYNSTINLFGLQYNDTAYNDTAYKTCSGLFFPVYPNIENKVESMPDPQNEYRFILLREVTKSVSADYGIYRFIKEYLNSILASQKDDKGGETQGNYALDFLSFFIGDLMINFLYNKVPKLELIRFLPVVFESSIIDASYNLSNEYVYVLFQNAWHKAAVMLKGDSIFLFDCERAQIKHSNKVIVETYDDRNYVCYP